MADAPLTGRDTIGTWLEHPNGATLIRELLGAAGFDESVLAPVRDLPLQQLVELSGGQLTQDTVDDLVRRANGGIMPEVADEPSAAASPAGGARFGGRTVIVTGAASGIGRATAERIAREGGRVIAVDLAADKLDELAASHGDAVVPVASDITLLDDIERVVAAAGGRVDGLANVAGIVDDFTAAHEVTDEMWRRVFAVNVDGLLRLTRAVLPLMLEAGQGSIVNVASEAALRGSAAGVAYTASKHAVVGMTKSCAFMYGPSGIRVNAVAPGGVATGMRPPSMEGYGWDRVSGAMGLMPPIALPEHLAASITFLLSDEGINVNGAILPSDGGWSVA